MNTYLFWLEGLAAEKSAEARSEQIARSLVWNQLTQYEQNAVESLECIDILYSGDN